MLPVEKGTLVAAPRNEIASRPDRNSDIFGQAAVITEPD
jgi:hypothetical protein